MEGQKLETSSVAIRKARVLLVYGTWGRNRSGAEVLWFEDGSQFLIQLREEAINLDVDLSLIEVPYWTTRNKYDDRARAVHDLSLRLKSFLKTNSKIPLLIIAHSHGGNIALKSLHDLKDISQSIYCVTLATPFLRSFLNDFKYLFDVSNVALYLSVTIYNLTDIYYQIFGKNYKLNDSFLRDNIPLKIVEIAACCWFSWRPMIRLTSQRSQAIHEKEISKFIDDDNYSETDDKLLILRGVSDEASIVLAIGNIVAFISRAVSRYAFGASITVIIINLIAAFIYIYDDFNPNFFLGLKFESAMDNGWIDWMMSPLSLPAIIIVVKSLNNFLRSFLFGDPTFRLSERIEVDVNSVPDRSSNTTIITLPPSSAGKLRHSLYNHPDAARNIMRWFVQNYSKNE